MREWDEIVVLAMQDEHRAFGFLELVYVPELLLNYEAQEACPT